MGRPESHVTGELLGKPFRFETTSGLFSADRIDDGTRLLLEHLPSLPPARVLDLGCGYGALGLPVARRYPNAHCLLVDRDLLAVEYARRNAASHALTNVETRPSLGYREVGHERFDWILCNVPARAGPAAIRYFIEVGARQLTPKGELRIVVIRDLKGTVESLADEGGWSIRAAASGSRHEVYGISALKGAAEVDHEQPYRHDSLRLGELELERPTDISEDPKHQHEGLPLFLQLLPRTPKGSALVWRGGYGGVALSLAGRGAQVVVADRDLLATTFSRRNADRLGFTIETRDAFQLASALKGGERFNFFAGEINPSATNESTRADLLASTQCLQPGAMALWLGLTRPARSLFETLSKSGRAHAAAIASAGPYTVWRVSQ